MPIDPQEVHPEEHLRLINRVIGQLGLRGDIAEEAFSESLVTIVEAARTYDPSYGVPVANWLGKNIRWGIQNWLGRQRQTDVIDVPVENPRAEFTEVDLNELLALCDRILTLQERQVVIAEAVGYSGKEIAKTLKISEGWVTKTKQRAQKKLKENS